MTANEVLERALGIRRLYALGGGPLPVLGGSQGPGFLMRVTQVLLLQGAPKRPAF